MAPDTPPVFLSRSAHLAVRGFNLLCVVCTPQEDTSGSLQLLHQHANRQRRCWMAFVSPWGPNVTLTAVCMCCP